MMGHAQVVCGARALKVIRMPPDPKPAAESRLPWDGFLDVGMTLPKDSLMSVPLFGSRLYFCLHCQALFSAAMLRMLDHMR